VNTARYVVAVLLLVYLPPAMLLWLVIHPFVGFWRRFGPLWTYLILAGPAVAMMAGLYLVRDTLLGPDLGVGLLPAMLAVGCLAAGIAIARKRGKFLTRAILCGVPELRRPGGDRGRLLTKGIYGRIRHPRYIEFLFWIGAYACFANYLGLYVLFGLSVLALYPIVLLEERELRDRFGEEYEAYCERVPRFVPKRR
jgi:protein-S-isoprenylcysteine O-methyltransferase Ste14